MTKHTQGPWRVINGFDENGDGKYFPSVVMAEKDDGNRFSDVKLTVSMPHDQEAESIMANAKLIAAAPDMLEALKKARTCSLPDYVESLIKDAIKKATS